MSGGMQERLEQLLDEIEGQPAAEPPAPSSRVETAPPPDGNPLGGLLANPELLAKLPSLLGALSPLMKQLGNPPPRAAGGTAQGRAHGGVPDRHRALLRALKPYLSPERRHATETMLELLELWDALSGMGLILPGLMGGAQVGSTEGEVEKDV